MVGNSIVPAGWRVWEKQRSAGNFTCFRPDSPTLQVPNDSILLAGIKDAFESAQEQYQENDHGDLEYKIHDGWDTVHGELVTFYDSEKDVPELDAKFGTPFYFDRILIPAKKADGTLIAAWAYVIHEINFSARYLPDGIWPENNKPEAPLCQ